MELTAKQLKDWEQTRKLGRKKYIWTHGVVAFGGPMFVAWLVYRLFISEKYNIYEFLGEFVVALAGAILVGYRQGGNRWKANERQFASSVQPDLR